LTKALTEAEKAGLGGAVFRNINLDCVDFARADLRGARFENVSLLGCDFTGADLRAAQFFDCDLRGSRFSEAQWGENVFHGSVFSRSAELSKLEAQEIESKGGTFLPTGAVLSRR
jgi:uncharacterized protein YjbI with pentapeptide repeats